MENNQKKDRAQHPRKYDFLSHKEESPENENPKIDVKNIDDDFHANDNLEAHPDDFDEGDYDGTHKREIRTPGL